MEEWKISSHATLKSHSSGTDDWSAVTLETCCSSGAEESGYRCSIDIAGSLSRSLSSRLISLWSGESAC